MARTKKEEVKAPKAKAPAVKKVATVIELHEDKPVVLTGKTTPEMEQAFTEVFPTGVIKTPESFLISKGIDPPIKSAPVHNITFHQLCELLNEFKNA